MLTSNARRSQPHATRSRSHGGLGLGLALSRGLIEMHGGTIRATSAGEGRGTQVQFTLPRILTQLATTTPPPTASSRFAGRRVLLIEDNRDAAETLRDLLELLGADVTVAYTAAAGIDAARARPPELVLCDIGLPDLSGHEVATALRREPGLAATRLIAVTGYGQDEDRRRALAAGFDAHVVKPVMPEQLERIASEMAAPRP